MPDAPSGPTLETLPQLFDTTEFQNLRDDQRAAILTQALGLAHQEMATRPGYDSDSEAGFTKYADAARAKLGTMKSWGETGANTLRGAGHLAKGLGQDVATAAMAAFDAGSAGYDKLFNDKFQQANKNDPDFHASGEIAKTWGDNFAIGLQRLGLSGDLLLKRGADLFSPGSPGNVLKSGLDDLKADIDNGKMPTVTADFADWLTSRSSDLKAAQGAWNKDTSSLLTKTNPDGTTAGVAYDPASSDWQDFLNSRSLQNNPENRMLLAKYVATRDPATWDQLRVNILKTAPQVGVDKQQDAARLSEGSQQFDHLFGDGASQHLTSSSDPIMVAGLVLPALRGLRAASMAAEAADAATVASRGARAVKLGVETAKSGAVAAGFGAASELEQNPQASAAQVFKSAADMAGAGALLHAIPGSVGLLPKAKGGAPEVPEPEVEENPEHDSEQARDAAAQAGAALAPESPPSAAPEVTPSEPPPENPPETPQNAPGPPPAPEPVEPVAPPATPTGDETAPAPAASPEPAPDSLAAARLRALQQAGITPPDETPETPPTPEENATPEGQQPENDQQQHPGTSQESPVSEDETPTGEENGGQAGGSNSPPDSGEAPPNSADNLQGDKAPAPEVKPPAAGPRTFSQRQPAVAKLFSDNPLIRFIHGTLGGIMSKSKARRTPSQYDGTKSTYEATPSNWDDVPSLSHPTHAQVYRGSTPPDVAAQQLYDAHLISDPSVSTMWSAIDSASKSAKDQAEGNTREGNAEAQTVDFEQQSREKKPGKAALTADDLKEGDSVTIGGEKMRVKGVDEFGNVELQDGTRFGIQTVNKGEVIYVENADLKPDVNGDVDYPPGWFDEPHVPKLKEGEEQGDLLEGSKEDPFNLVGETADERAEREAKEDAARRQREAGEKKAAAEQAEKEQQKLELPESGNAPDALDRLANALDKRRDDLRKNQAGNLFMKINPFGSPEGWALDVARAAVWIAQNGRDFARWSASVLKEFGEGAKDKLQDVWDAAIKAAPDIGAEKVKSGEWVSSVQEDMQTRRAAMGLDPLEKDMPVDLRKDFEAVRAEIAADPELPKRLVDELDKNPRPVTSREQAILTHHLATLEKGLKHYGDIADNLNLTAPERLEASNRYSALADDLARLQEVDFKAGSEWGRAGRWRQQRMDQDFNLVNMERQRRLSTGQDKLTDEQSKQVRDLQRDLDKAKKRIAELEKNLDGEKGQQTLQGINLEEKQRAKKGDKAVTPEDVRAALEKAKKDKLTDIPQSLLEKLARYFIGKGVDKINPLIDAMHKALEPVIDGVTPRDVRDALTKYGQSKFPSQEAIDVKLSDLKRQGQLVSAMEDVLGGNAPKKTGPQRNKPSADVRDMSKQLKDLMREHNINARTSQEQLASALDAVKSRLRNQVEDLNRRLQGRTSQRPGRKEIPLDDEARKLLKERNELSSYLKDLEGTANLTPAEWNRRAMKAAQRSIDQLDRRIREKDFDKASGPGFPESDELKKLRQQREDMQEQFQQLRDLERPDLKEAARLKSAKDRMTDRIEEIKQRLMTGRRFQKGSPVALDAEGEALKAEAARLGTALKMIEGSKGTSDETRIKSAKTNLEKQITELERRIKEKDTTPKPKGTPVETDEIKQLRQQRDFLKEIYDAVDYASKPHPTPEALALARVKRVIERSSQEWQRRIRERDFAPKTKKETAWDAERFRLTVERERLKDQWQRMLYEDRQSKRTMGQKVGDFLVNWKRLSVLSSPVVYGKLTAAALSRLVTGTAEGFAGEAWSRMLPSELVKQAGIEGGGLNIKAIAEAYTKAYMKVMQDAADTVRTGKTEVDLLHGKSHADAEGWTNFFGRQHAMLKSPIKRLFFEHALSKLNQAALADGVDISSPMVQARLGAEAYKAAQRAIFMQDNALSSAFNQFIGGLERAGGGWSGLAKALKVILPIVKVPTNVVLESGNYVGGLPIGLYKLAKVWKNGVESMTPQETEVLFRQLKKGSVGAALMLFGYFNPQHVGGYYQPGERRQTDDVKGGGFRVAGWDVPRWMTHAPAFEAMQFGATLRRLMDQGTDLPSAAGASALGLASEVPFLDEMFRLSDLKSSRGRERFWGELAKSQVEPALLQKVAEWSDPAARRDPTNIVEYLKSGIPGLREQVPEHVGRQRR